MDTPKFIRHETISIKNHPVLDETWVKERIREDPTILGLGEIIVKDIERKQPPGGRLDMLLQSADPEEKQRYVVEVMLGAVDESHIIRTIEYWDIENRRYPQYTHTAVIIAEDITSRFLNVISIFNRQIPLIAIKMSMFKVGDNIILQFTKVLDVVDRGEEDEDEELPGGAVDRGYWEERGTVKTVADVDECLIILKEIDPNLSMKFNRYYIGLESKGFVMNFVTFQPQKKLLRIRARVGDKEVWLKRLDEAGLNAQTGRVMEVRLMSGEVEQHKVLLKELFGLVRD
jgi:hypothetical protein